MQQPKRAFVLSAALIGFAILTVRPAAAGFFAAANLPLSYRTWTLESDSTKSKTTLSQFHAPLEATVALGPNADLLVATSGASAHLDLEAGDTVALDGRADVAAQVIWRLAADRLLLQGGVNLPTGKRELNQAQFALARLLGQPLLGFRLDEYGRGLDWTAGVAATLPIRDRVVFGIGAGYVEHGEYKLLADGGEYRPGSEGSVSFGWDAGIDAAGQSPVRLDATYRFYDRDELGPTVVFEEGDQFEAQLDARARDAGLRPHLLLRVVSKQDNLARGPFGDTVASIKTRAGKQYVASAGIERGLSDRLSVGLDGSWMRFAQADPPGQEGNAFEVGPRLGLLFGDTGRIDLGARYLSGTLEPRTESGTPLSRVSLTGMMFSLGLSLAAR